MSDISPPVTTKYRFSRSNTLGSGAFADVFLGTAVTGTAKRQVAIKRVAKAKARNDPKMQRQLRNEIVLLRELRGHPNVVELIDSREDDAYIHIILEYCNGGDLSKHLRQCAPLPEAHTHDVMLQLAEALKHTRANHVVHRDIKPHNVLLTINPKRRCGFDVKLSDFGFACQMAPSDMTATFCGSPLHMAPEVLAGEQYDPKIDLWSIGTIAYQMATGATPYRAKTTQELKQKLRDAHQRLPVPGHYTSEFADLSDRLLRVDPKERIEFEAFFEHPFFKLQFGEHHHVVPGRPAMLLDFKPAPDEVAVAASSAATAATTTSINPASFVVVDRRAAEFAEQVHDAAAHADAAAPDDAEQRALRDAADRAVRKARLILHAADDLSIFERLVLHGRAIGMLREARPARARDRLRDMHPCCATLVSALRFSDTFEHCLTEIDRLRIDATAAPAPAVDEQRAPDELLLDAGTLLADRAARHAATGDAAVAKALYDDSAMMVTLARGATDSDRARIDRYAAELRRRRDDVGASVGPESCMVAARAGPPESAPIRIPVSGGASGGGGGGSGSNRAIGAGARRAAFCGSCGLRYNCASDNFCNMCGTHRPSLASLGASSSNTTPRSLSLM